MGGELGDDFRDGLSGPGRQALRGDADGERQVPAQVGEVPGCLGFLADACGTDDMREQFDCFLAAQQSQFGAVHGFQAGQAVAAGDEGEGSAVAGQQRTDLVLGGGVVEKEEHASRAQNGAQQAGSVLGV